MMRKNMRVILSAALLLALMVSIQAIPQEEVENEITDSMRGPDVVYVGTPYDIVSKMLAMAEVKKGDVVYDLGCGDGRMLVLAAQKYGCKAVGYDIDPTMVREARNNVKRNHVEDLVKIIQADIFTLDLTKANVFPIYLLPELNKMLLPQFDQLKDGCRIVTHDYGLEGIVSDKTITVSSNEDNADHILTLYTTPLKRENAVEPVE